MLHRALPTAVAGCALISSASAAITFTFDDPFGAHEVQYTQSGSGGALNYQLAPMSSLDLIVDATQEGAAAPFSFAADLNIQIQVGAATPIIGVPNGFTAPISGSFFFLDAMAPSSGELLRGTFSAGTLVTIGNAGALITTDAESLVYTASGSLLTQLNSLGITQLTNDFSLFDAVFTLTDIAPGVSLDVLSRINDFSANAAFTGTASRVPSPAPLFAMTIGAAGVFGRRRRRQG